MNQATKLLCVSLLALLGVGSSEARRQFFHHESHSRSLDGGLELFNEISGSFMDSERDARHHHESLARPSQFEQTMRASDNSVQSHAQHQASRSAAAYTLNGVPLTGQQRRQLEESLAKSFASHGGFRRGFLKRAGAGATHVRPRTVEPPALSVDSGGRSSAGTRLASTISKMFRVDQGHYADVYNRIDNHRPLSTRRPAELIDETLERIL